MIADFLEVQDGPPALTILVKVYSVDLDPTS